MKSSALLVLTTLVGSTVFGSSTLTGCGPSMEPGGVKSPEERLQEEERLAYEAEQREKQNDANEIVPDAVEQEDEFDTKQAELEMKRASLSARTCVDVVEGAKGTKGVADITVVFANDGNVKDTSISPHGDTPLGECVLNAYRGVIVPPFRESEYSLSWQLDFEAKPPAPAEEEGDAEKGDDKKKKKK